MCIWLVSSTSLIPIMSYLDLNPVGMMSSLKLTTIQMYHFSSSLTVMEVVIRWNVVGCVQYMPTPRRPNPTLLLSNLLPAVKKNVPKLGNWMIRQARLELLQELANLIKRSWNGVPREFAEAKSTILNNWVFSDYFSSVSPTLLLVCISLSLLCGCFFISHIKQRVFLLGSIHFYVIDFGFGSEIRQVHFLCLHWQLLLLTHFNDSI